MLLGSGKLELQIYRMNIVVIDDVAIDDCANQLEGDDGHVVDESRFPELSGSRRSSFITGYFVHM